MTAVDSWHGLRAGDQVGNLEYMVDAAALARYRQIVGANGCFPDLMAEDCRAMLATRAAGETLTTVWQRLEFMRPPILGRRIQVGGWIREVRHARDRVWIRAAAFAVDEIGTEILRSEAAFLVGCATARSEHTARLAEAQPEALNLPSSHVGDTGSLGQLRLPGQEQLDGYREVANAMAATDLSRDGNGPTSIIAGWLEGLMGANFGEDFRWGGKLSIAHHRTLTPAMTLHCDGVVLGRDTDVRGVEKWQVAMLVRDADGHQAATAEAVVESPSPKLV